MVVEEGGLRRLLAVSNYEMKLRRFFMFLYFALSTNHQPTEWSKYLLQLLNVSHHFNFFDLEIFFILNKKFILCMQCYKVCCVSELATRVGRKSV